MKQLLLTGMTPFILASLLACGTWVGNPTDQTSGSKGGSSGTQTASLLVEVKAFSSTSDDELTAPHINKDGAAAGSVKLDEVVISLESLAFVKDGKETASVTWGGAKLVSLHNAATEIARDVAVTPGSFDQIVLRARSTANVLTLKGTFTDDDLTARLDLAFENEMAIVLPVKSDEGSLAAGETASLTVSFDLDKWFTFTGREVDLASFGANIDSSAASSRLGPLMVGNIEQSAKVEKNATPAPEPTDDDDDKDDD